MKRKHEENVYISNDVWGHVMDFLPYSTAKTLARCNWNLYTYFDSRNTAYFSRYTTSETDKFALEQSRSKDTTRHVLEGLCQLCNKSYRRGMVHPTWNIYAHPECIGKETLAISTASKLYDIPYEYIGTIRFHENLVWRYHGGRTFLPFGVMDTLQGISLKYFNESLYDRRCRIESLRQSHQESAQTNDTEIQNYMKRFRAAKKSDADADDQKRQARLDSCRDQRRQKLEPLLTGLDEGIKELLRYCIYNHVSMPASWKQVESIVVELRLMQWPKNLDRPQYLKFLLDSGRSKMVLSPSTFFRAKALMQQKQRVFACFPIPRVWHGRFRSARGIHGRIGCSGPCRSFGSFATSVPLSTGLSPAAQSASVWHHCIQRGRHVSEGAFRTKTSVRQA